MLGHRLRRWPNIKPAWVLYLVFVNQLNGSCFHGRPASATLSHHTLVHLLVFAFITLCMLQQVPSRAESCTPGVSPLPTPYPHRHVYQGVTVMTSCDHVTIMSSSHINHLQWIVGQSYRQLKVGKNYTHLSDFSPNICKTLTHISQ